MLSEPRRKKRRIGDDPNNLRWAKDDNGVGKKLLEKMGWRSGVGLGANEQGRQNPLAIHANSGFQGLGCESKADIDVHSQHRRDFDVLLQSLNGKKDDEGERSHCSSISPCSLTSISKSSRRRIHYSRFAKGKELSTASAIDLATVTGDLPQSVCGGSRKDKDDQSHGRWTQKVDRLQRRSINHKDHSDIDRVDDKKGRIANQFRSSFVKGSE